MYSSFKFLLQAGYDIPDTWKIATLKDGETMLLSVREWMAYQEGKVVDRKPTVFLSNTHDKNFWAMDEIGSKLSPEMLKEMSKYCTKLQTDGKLIAVKIPPDGLWNKIKFWWRGGYKNLNQFRELFYGQTK